LRPALALVVARAGPDRIDPPGVLLALRMHARVAVHLARRRLQDLRLRAPSETQHIDRAVHAGLRRLHRIALVMHGRRRANGRSSALPLLTGTPRDSATRR